MAEEFPWFRIVSGRELLQGDIIEDCPLIVPSEVAKGEEGTVQQLQATQGEADVVVMTQSCDLVASKVDQVLLCPVRTLSDLQRSKSHFRDKKLLNRIIDGNVVGLHMIDECDLEGHERERRIVSLQEMYILPLELLRRLAEAAGDRLRLLPPYREHLSQAFARFFMRVGLPENIRKFDVS